MFCEGPPQNGITLGNIVFMGIWLGPCVKSQKMQNARMKNSKCKNVKLRFYCTPHSVMKNQTSFPSEK
jgi:hypothetical protein